MGVSDVRADIVGMYPFGLDRFQQGIEGSIRFMEAYARQGTGR